MKMKEKFTSLFNALIGKEIRPDLSELGFIVIDTRAEKEPHAAFASRRDATAYIRWRHQEVGPDGPSYEIVDTDGCRL
jgi:hypothetical protein